MRCFRTRGKKGDKHRDPCDPPRRRANKRRGHGTYENDRPPVVGNRRSGKWPVPVARAPAYRWKDVAETRARLHHRKTPPVTRMSGRATTASSGITTRCVMARKNGPGMTMAMASGRSIPTQLKACGRRHAIFCARFGASTKNICTAIWPCVNIKSISNASVPHLSLGSSPSTDQLHEPNSSFSILHSLQPRLAQGGKNTL